MKQDVPITLHQKLCIKYLLDRILAWILLVILAPFILLFALLIKSPPSKILLFDLLVVRKALRTFFVGEKDDWLLMEKG